MTNHIFLTGGTGFIGTQVARKLIKNPENLITVLVRASNKQIALNRLKRSWWDWPELLEALETQINVLTGDVAHENLGMDSNEFDLLASDITHIIHIAADLRLHAPIQELRKINVYGTSNVLKLGEVAQQKGKFERFSHVSTAYVAGKAQGAVKEELLSGKDGFWSTYEQSKFEAEQLVVKSKLPYSIFRPGMVVGDSQNGEIKTFNTLYVLLKYYLKGNLRLIPTSPSLKLTPVPVDYVALAVTNLSFNSKAKNKIFHLTPPPSQLPTIKEILSESRKWALKEIKIKLPSPTFLPVSYPLKKLSSSSFLPKKGLWSVLSTLAPYLDEKRDFLPENTIELLGPYHLDWKDYLPKLLEYAVYHGFFHRTERTVHEQVIFRLKSKSFPVKLYDIVDGEIREKNGHEIRQQALKAASSLKTLGIRKGDRVALVGLNSTRYLTVELAIGLLGAISVPLYYTSPLHEIKKILKSSGAKILFIGTPYLIQDLGGLQGPKKVSFCRNNAPCPDSVISWQEFLEMGEYEDLQAPVDFNDLATIRYTSGTTGQAKGVTFNHGNLRWMAESMASLPSWEDRNQPVFYLSFLPMNHVVEGILGTYSPYYAPAPLNLYFLENFHELAEILPRVRPTIFFSVPRFYEKVWSQVKKSGLGHYYLQTSNKTLKKTLKKILKRYVLKNAGLDRCSQLIVGSATSSQKLLQDFQDLGVEIHNAYGLTEAPLLTLNRRGKNVIGTVGEPLPCTKIKISPQGEVMIKGPQVTPGYYENDLKISKKEGWLYTGDLGYLTPENNLVITGRKKELIINSYGKSIDPLHIEAFLRDLPGVEEAMLVGEGKPYLSALLWVENHHLMDMQEEIGRINGCLSSPERIKRWAILPNDLSIESGELTANLKLKRQIITNHYQEVIDAIYNSTSDPRVLKFGGLEE